MAEFYIVTKTLWVLRIECKHRNSITNIPASSVYKLVLEWYWTDAYKPSIEIPYLLDYRPEYTEYTDYILKENISYIYKTL